MALELFPANLEHGVANSYVRLDTGRIAIYKRSPMTKVVHCAVIPFTEEQWDEFHGPGNIQDRASHLDAETREFLKTGYTPADWAELFPVGDEEAA